MQKKHGKTTCEAAGRSLPVIDLAGSINGSSPKPLRAIDQAILTGTADLSRMGRKWSEKGKRPVKRNKNNSKVHVPCNRVFMVSIQTLLVVGCPRHVKRTTAWVIVGVHHPQWGWSTTSETYIYCCQTNLRNRPCIEHIFLDQWHSWCAASSKSWLECSPTKAILQCNKEFTDLESVCSQCMLCSS